MSDLNELFAELKNEIDASRNKANNFRMSGALERLFEIDALINNGEFARAEQDAYIG